MKFSFSLFIVAVIFISCERDLEVDIPREKTKLVANSLFEPDSTVTVNVSLTKHILDDSPTKLINDAVVQLRTGNNVENLVNTGNGNYTSNTKISSQTTYELTVSHSDYDIISASSTCPQELQYSVVETKIKGEDNFGNVEGIVTINFEDPSNQDDYYEIAVSTGFVTKYIYDFFGNKTDSIYAYSSTSFNSKDGVFAETASTDVGGSGEYYFYEAAYFSDILIDGQSKNIELTIPYISKNNVIQIKINRLSREAYLYKLTLDKYRWANGDPFSQPVQIYTNVENGFGIFAGQSSPSATNISF